MENIILKNGNKVVQISPLGAEPKSLKSDEKEYLWQGDKNTWNGQAPILFPICGRLKNAKYIHNGVTYELGIHGFARKSLFKVLNKNENSATLLLESNEETLKSYPFEFKFYVTYTLTEKLNIEYKIENLGTDDMYFCVGSHEGYIADGDISDYRIEFEKEENFINVVHNSDGLLTGEKVNIGQGKVLQLKDEYFIDDATIILENINSRSVTLLGKKNGLKIKIEFSEFNNLLIWKVYSGKFVCIEPWTALPDSVDCDNILKNKPSVIKLTQGESKIFTHKITF